MKQAYSIYIIIIVSLLVSCGTTAVETPAEVLKDEPIAVEQPAHINFSVDQITLLTDVQDLNEYGELRLFVIVSDENGRSAGMFCPSGAAFPVKRGTVINKPCAAGLFFEEDTLGDVLHILILAVDEDQTSLGGELAYEGIINGLSEGLVSLAFTKDVASVSSGPVGFGINMLVNFLSGQIKDWIEEADIYGSEKINLLRSKEWGVGQQVTFKTKNDGLEVKYSVTRSSKPMPQIIILNENPTSELESIMPTADNGNSTPMNNLIPVPMKDPDDVVATNNGEVEVKFEDKILYVQRSDGAESRFGPLGDGVYEVSENGMFIVYCTNDGFVFAGRIGDEYLKKVGEVKDFTIIRMDDKPQLSLRIQEYGYDSFIVQVNERLENDGASFKIPRLITWEG